MHKISVLYLLLVLTLLFFDTSGCNKKPDVQNQNLTDKKDFSWKQELTLSDIPDFPVKGYLNGKEVSFTYIVFERWRGSNDNDIIFSISKPSQQCGYIENYQGFQLINKGNKIDQGVWSKSKFEDDPKTYQCSYVYKTTDGNSVRSSVNWNCVLKIDSVTNEDVNGMIAICFDDAAISWIAGRFHATICNN